MSAAPLIPTEDEIREHQAWDEFHMWDEKVWRHWLWLARDLSKSPEIMRRVQNDDFANNLLNALFKGNHKYAPDGTLVWFAGEDGHRDIVARLRPFGEHHSAFVVGGRLRDDGEAAELLAQMGYFPT